MAAWNNWSLFLVLLFDWDLAVLYAFCVKPSDWAVKRTGKSGPLEINLHAWPVGIDWEDFFSEVYTPANRVH